MAGRTPVNMESVDQRNPEETPVPWWAYCLLPAGRLYLAAAGLRNAWYARRGGVSLGRPSVSVGNLTFGGTGKTPVAIELARRLAAMGKRPAVLLRGYGRRTTGPLLVHDGDRPTEVGEEALLLSSALPGVPVVVAERREEAAALVAGTATVYVLDDAYQHVRVKREVNLLLVDATRPGDLRPPPVGRLRESLSAARRADLLLVTRGRKEDLPRVLEPWVRGVPVVGTRFEWEEGVVNGRERRPWTAFEGVPMVAFAAVGNPDAFFRQARSHNLKVVAEKTWPDHAESRPDRLEELLGMVRRHGAEAVLTTEKDAVKWLPLWPGHPPLLYPSLSVRFDDSGIGVDRALARLAEGGG